MTAKASEFISTLHSRRNFAESLKATRPDSAEPSDPEPEPEPEPEEPQPLPHRSRRPSKITADPDFIVGPEALVLAGGHHGTSKRRRSSSDAGAPEAKRKRGRPPSESKPAAPAASTSTAPKVVPCVFEDSDDDGRVED